MTGETVGFGARRLFEEDQGPKYLNTPETPLYKKSQVLYGIDLAKRDLQRDKRVVVVEGYTDVMAMHLSGVGTAVATCGTAFGSDHARIVRRLDRRLGVAAAASSWRPAPRWAARSSSRSTATPPVRRPRCGRSARTSRSRRRRSSPSRSPAWTRASCARPRVPTPSARSWPAGRRCTSSSSARRSRPTTCAPPRAGSAPCARPPRSSRASATPPCGPSTPGC